jgi:N-acetylmuramic acid 6-phosphate etherase
MDYDKIPTEQVNLRAKGLDRLSVIDAVRLMDREDARMLAAVRRTNPAVARAVALIERRMSAGGRLFFAGAGTSGRLGILEAAECPPTFDTAPGQVQALMAGGRFSVFKSKEGAEDRGDEASAFVLRRLRRQDVLVGVAASGVTAFAKAALAAARKRGAGTILVTCNPGAPRDLADVTIAAATGPEVVSGSTRLKAGTATKIILNRLTTLAMVRLGKTYGPYMVDLQPRSRKLKARAFRLVRMLGGVDAAEAELLLSEAKGRAKTAILMAKKKIPVREADRLLRRAGGFLAKALAVLLLTVTGLKAEVLTGLDVLEKNGFAELRNKRVGVIVNHTSIDRAGRHLVDVFLAQKSLQLAAVFTPEHGLSGREEAGRWIAHTTYTAGVPLYSLYASNKRPMPEMLKDLDVVVFDLQDVGSRIYTYLTTMAYAMEEAGKAGLEFIVLDRPNPLGGDGVEGEILDIGAHRGFTGYFPVPVRHGMTAGEIALLHQKNLPGLRLTVVKMKGWHRRMQWRDTGLRFSAPSPNIRTPGHALLYAGVGCFEATNLGVGRGTRKAFHVLSAPWLDGKSLAAQLSALNLPGVSFSGRGHEARIHVKDPRAVRPVDIFVHASWLLRRTSYAPRWEEMPFVTGTTEFAALYQKGAPVDDYLNKAHGDALLFAEERRPYLLYD